MLSFIEIITEALIQHSTAPQTTPSKTTTQLIRHETEIVSTQAEHSTLAIDDSLWVCCI